MLVGPADKEAIRKALMRAIHELGKVDETGNKEADAKILEAERAIRAALGKL